MRWLDRGDKVFHGISVVVNHSTGRIANTLEVLEGHVDLVARRPPPSRRTWPSASMRRSPPTGPAWQLPLSGTIGVRR